MLNQYNPGSKATLVDHSYRQYAITIKKNRNDAQARLEDLNEIADALPYCVSRRRYEIDSHNKLHLHAVMTAPKSLRYKTCQRSGWNIYIRRINNFPRWKAYCDKDSRCTEEQDQLIHCHYIKYIWTFPEGEE